MKEVNSTLTLDALKDTLEYKQQTGEFVWLVNRRCVKAGAVAGSVNHDGYIRIKLFGVQYFAHRLAWLYMTGKWPNKEIDHIDRIKNNNKWENLRETTHSENMQNRELKNKTGFSGISLHQYGKWQARIRKKGVRMHIGTFDTPEQANDAYIAAAKSM